MTAEVEVGFFSFSEVTDPSEHRSYNEWHQLDHLPEQYRLAGVAHGQRWVSTPACRAAWRFCGGPAAQSHYMTLYLMTAPVSKTLEEFRALGSALYEEGRFHLMRRAGLAGPFALVDRRAAKRALVSAQVIPFRPNLGVYVIAEPLESGSPGDAPVDGAFLAERMCSAPGVAGVWSFVSLEGFERLGWQPGRRRITVCYLDEPPLSVVESLDTAMIEALGERRPPELAGPFETITPWSWDWFDEFDEG